MKRTFIPFLLLAAILGTVLGSCGKGKPESSADFKSELTAEDTTQMLALSEQCMKALKAGKTDAALAMLYTYDDSTGTVSPISEDLRREFKNMFMLFPVKDFKLHYFSFNNQGVNDVKYDIAFMEKQEGIPNTIGFMFNPVRVDGTWYLTVKRPGQPVDSLRRG